VISPSPLASLAIHVERFALPRAMFTMVMSSFTVTSRLPLQSPVHGAMVGVAVIVALFVVVEAGVGVAVGGCVEVPVGSLLGVGVGLAIRVGVEVRVFVGVRVGVGIPVAVLVGAMVGV